MRAPIVSIVRRLLQCLALGCVVLPAHALTVEYIHTDALGTPVAVTNSAGVVIERSEYEPYGQLLNRPLTDGPGYTGHVSDAATGLSYMQQRYYDPGIGRFLSVDPVTANGNTGANFNRYWYANSNPYKFTDPDGRQACVGTIEKINCIRKPEMPRSPGERFTFQADGDGESEAAEESKAGAYAKGVGQGAYSYVKGIAYDLPKHALERNGAFGEERELSAIDAEAAVIKAINLISENPKQARKIACIACMNLTPEQEANLQGRLGARLAVGGMVSAVSGPVGAAASVGAITGNVLNAGVDINDQGEIIRTILFGVSE